jgi:site-specific recombinase XerD
MLKVNFNLRKINTDEPQIIYAVFRVSNKRLVFPTPFKVKPKNFNDKQRVKTVLDEPNKDKINSYLNGLEKDSIAFYSKSIAQNGCFEFLALKEYLYSKSKPVVVPTKVTLFSFIAEFIENSPERINRHSGKSIAHKTIQKYKTTFEYLKEFQKKQTKVALDFEHITMKFCERFTGFLTAKQMRPNSVNKHVSTLQTFLNEAVLQGLSVPNDFKSQNFNVKKVEVDKVSLSEYELDLILNYDFSNNERLDRIRDLFLLGAWTGLRFSDFSTLKPENIKGDRIRKEQFKTGAIVTIPILPVVDLILKKYNNILPQSISNQKTNKYLKEVCQLVGINERIEIVETRGGVSQTNVFDKWQLVSTHTARRSFATNMYKKGIPSRAIMAVTGHKTELAFNKYIKIDGEQFADMLEKGFNKEPTKTIELKKIA